MSDEQALSPVRELIKARIREFLREPGYVFWVFGFPLLMAIGLGLAFRSKAPEPPRIGITDRVAEPTARALTQSPRLRAERLSRAEAERQLARTKIDLVVDRSEPPALTGEVHAAVTAAYHAKYDRYGPRIVGTVVSADSERSTLRILPR